MSDTDFPFLVLSTHGVGYVMKGEDLGSKVDKVLHSLLSMAGGKNVEDFTEKLDLHKEPI